MVMIPETHLTQPSFSGAATTASRLGQPDLAIATLNDFVQVRCFHSQAITHLTLTLICFFQAGSMVASLNPSVPVIADADTG